MGMVRRPSPHPGAGLRAQASVHQAHGRPTHLAAHADEEQALDVQRLHRGQHLRVCKMCGMCGVCVCVWGVTDWEGRW